ncbi:MAG: hypothetical protein H7124_15485 [Phycisphaerales bacterium]|nr:hypothetical protein [Hyphomonadaceae bacterium]
MLELMKMHEFAARRGEGLHPKLLGLFAGDQGDSFSIQTETLTSSATLEQMRHRHEYTGSAGDRQPSLVHPARRREHHDAGQRAEE